MIPSNSHRCQDLNNALHSVLSSKVNSKINIIYVGGKKATHFRDIAEVTRQLLDSSDVQANDKILLLLQFEALMKKRNVKISQKPWYKRVFHQFLSRVHNVNSCIKAIESKHNTLLTLPNILENITFFLSEQNYGECLTQLQILNETLNKNTFPELSKSLNKLLNLFEQVPENEQLVFMKNIRIIFTKTPDSLRQLASDFTGELLPLKLTDPSADVKMKAVLDSIKTLSSIPEEERREIINITDSFARRKVWNGDKYLILKELSSKTPVERRLLKNLFHHLPKEAGDKEINHILDQLSTFSSNNIEELINPILAWQANMTLISKPKQKDISSYLKQLPTISSDNNENDFQQTLRISAMIGAMIQDSKAKEMDTTSYLKYYIDLTIQNAKELEKVPPEKRASLIQHVSSILKDNRYRSTLCIAPLIKFLADQPIDQVERLIKEAQFFIDDEIKDSNKLKEFDFSSDTAILVNLLFAGNTDTAILEEICRTFLLIPPIDRLDFLNTLTQSGRTFIDADHLVLGIKTAFEDVRIAGKSSFYVEKMMDFSDISEDDKEKILIIIRKYKNYLPEEISTYSQPPRQISEAINDLKQWMIIQYK